MNEKKTRRCDLPAETVHVSWVHVRAALFASDGSGIHRTGPGGKKVQRLCRNLSDATDRRTCSMATPEKVRTLNSDVARLGQLLLSGSRGQLAYEKVMKHARRRLRRWLCRKYRVRVGQYTRFPNEYLHEQLGLIQLRKTRQNLLWAKG